MGYPPLEYSDEETAQLLARAHTNIPERTGKRGTRRIKRGKDRWHVVRQRHKKYKFYKKREHINRMGKRSRILKEVKQVKAEAPGIRAKDKAYQEYILQQWAAAMTSEYPADNDAVPDNEGQQQIEA